MCLSFRAKGISFRFIKCALAFKTASDLDGGGHVPQVWWETPCVDTKYLGRG